MQLYVLEYLSHQVRKSVLGGSLQDQRLVSRTI